MRLDPAQPLPATPEARTGERLAALERELAELRRGNAAIAVGDGPPGSDPNALREGTRYIDRTNRRLYLVVGVAPASAWRYTALT
jgi:hypothetical protein